MTEEDRALFVDAYGVYLDFAGRVIPTEEWPQIVRKIVAFAVKYRWRDNPLAFWMAIALMHVFDELYRNGGQPTVLDYLGRKDLS